MRLVFVLFLLAGNLIAVGQQRPPMGRPNQFTQGWNRFGYLQSDSGLIIAERDTTFKPRYGATVVYRRGDRKFYYYDSVYAAWYPLASDTTGSVNDKFNNLTALASAAVNFPVNSILSTKGFYSPNDGGAATYIITTDTISGLPIDSVSQIRLSNGLYCVLYHLGVIRWEQFGAKGDSITNDMLYFDKCMNYARHDRSVNTILGAAGKRYRLAKLSLVPDDIETNCFMRLDFGDITFDFQGAKVIFDNNAMQSYVYYTDGSGVTGLYRCKKTNVGQQPLRPLYWSNYYWQLMQDSVTITEQYPVWDTTVTYYGAMDFAHIGFFPADPRSISNITWKNLELTANEPDSICLLDGYWNINAKAFLDLDKIRTELWTNVKMHNIISEVVYGGGGGTGNNGGYIVEKCQIYISHNAISHGGDMIVRDNVIHDCPANAVESFPNGEKQYYQNNIIYNCRNGITEGGPGNDINIESCVTINSNWIHDCEVYGIYISGKVRGCTITENQLYDNGAGNISMYALSVDFANPNTEIIISENIIGCYKENTGGITINSAHVNPDQPTSNVIISDNIFGRLSVATIQGYSSVMSFAISFAGTQYKNITISGNSIGDGVTRFLNYADGAMPRHLISNSQVGSIEPQYIYATEFQTQANPVSFTPSNISEQLTNIIAVNSATNVCYFKTPDLYTAFNNIKFDGVYLISANNSRIVLLPGHDDDLGSRSKVIAGGGLIQDPTIFTKGVYIQFVKADKNNATSQDGKKSFHYIFSNNQNVLPLTVSASVSTSGTLAAGDSVSVQFSFDGPVYLSGAYGASGYDLFSFDSLAASNLAFNALFSVDSTLTQIDQYHVSAKIKNISGSPQSLDGSVVAIKLYPMGNTSFLANALQPLRTEGRTSMRPVGSDIPNGFIYFDTEVNRKIRWDANAQIWTAGAIPSVISGTATPTSIPLMVGDIYVDVTNKKLYFATGTTSSSDWTIAN